MTWIGTRRPQRKAVVFVWGLPPATRPPCRHGLAAAPRPRPTWTEAQRRPTQSPGLRGPRVGRAVCLEEPRPPAWLEVEWLAAGVGTLKRPRGPLSGRPMSVNSWREGPGVSVARPTPCPPVWVLVNPPEAHADPRPQCGAGHCLGLSWALASSALSGWPCGLLARPGVHVPMDSDL